jgi:hypothetical protein
VAVLAVTWLPSLPAVVAVAIPFLPPQFYFNGTGMPITSKNLLHLWQSCATSNCADNLSTIQLWRTHYFCYIHGQLQIAVTVHQEKPKTNRSTAFGEHSASRASLSVNIVSGGLQRSAKYNRASLPKPWLSIAFNIACIAV